MLKYLLKYTSFYSIFYSNWMRSSFLKVLPSLRIADINWLYQKNSERSLNHLAFMCNVMVRNTCNNLILPEKMIFISPLSFGSVARNSAKKGKLFFFLFQKLYSDTHSVLCLISFVKIKCQHLQTLDFRCYISLR